MENIFLSLIAILAMIYIIKKVQGSSSDHCGGCCGSCPSKSGSFPDNTIAEKVSRSQEKAMLK